MLAFFYLELILYSMTKTGPSLPECLLPTRDYCSGGCCHLLLMGTMGEKVFQLVELLWLLPQAVQLQRAASIGEPALAKFAHRTQSLLGVSQQSSPMLA